MQKKKVKAPLHQNTIATTSCFFESFDYINNAIAGEKGIKAWDRKKKLSLIKSFNPEFKCLNKELLGEWPPKELT
jgi:predicted GIY-YIG superfamily endonuclease